MKNKRFKNFLWGVVSIILTIPTMANSAINTVPGGIGGSSNNTPTKGSTIPNPLGESTIIGLLKGALKVMLEIAIPVAALALVYSGFLFVKAQGNEEDLTKAKSVFFWTIIGTAVILGAWVFTQGICVTIQQLGASGIKCG